MNTEKSGLKGTVAALLLGLLMASLDQTIVSTALPTIVQELGGLDQFVWVFSAYIIASVTGMPILGKLSDIYGRKKLFFFGMITFLTGSVLCATADTMMELILFRALQGIGGGAMMPISFTVIFDLFPPEKRGKMTGLFGAVFGISSVFGPYLGGYITDYLSWHWIFLINVPIGIISMGLMWFFYHEHASRRSMKIDWAGAVLIIFAILSFMFALELGGHTYAWSSPQVSGLFVLAVLLLVAFGVVERRAEDPVVPLTLFRNRLFSASQSVGFFYAFIMIAAVSYIPLFVQGVFGGSASDAGSVLTPMMISVVISAQIGGRLSGKFSYRAIMFTSVILLSVAMYLLSGMTIDTPRWEVTIFMIMAGLGIGMTFPVISMASIHSVPPERRGVATSSSAFFRTIGQAVGVTVLGAIQSAKMNSLMPSVPGMPELSAQSLLQPEVRAAIESKQPALYAQMTAALAESITYLFMISFIFIGITLISIWLMGDSKLVTTRPEQQKKPEPETATS